jgi:diguanylate cyclase (GGDEF)-like protein/PAS domain S-box-containing protein
MLITIRKMQRWGVLLCLGMCITCLSHLVSAEPELQPITVQLKWQHQFQFAGFYAAVEKGFYRQAGFEVTLKQASPTINPIDEVIAGRADYGVANSELLLYHQRGAPVTALAVLIQHSPLVLVSLLESKILSPQDLIGKRVMFPEGPYGANTIGILSTEGVRLSQVQQVPLSFDLKDLLQGNVDAMVGYSTDLPYQLDQHGARYDVMDPRRYGIDFYGDTLFTSKERVKDHADEVKRFREATLSGWRYAVKHPEEIVHTLLQKYHAQKSYEELMYEAQATISLIVPELVDVGHMNPGRWRHIGDTFAKLGMGPAEIDLEDFLYDPQRNDFAATLRLGFLIGGLIVLLAGIYILMLMIFNSRLKNKVMQHTDQLQAANQTLVEKEHALNKLNQVLEKRVEERTDALAQANEELTLEIAERHQRELSLRLLSKAVQSSRSGVIIIDEDHVVVYVNASFLAITGLHKASVLSQPLSALEGRLSLPNVTPTQWKNLEDTAIREEVLCQLPDAQPCWLQVSVSPIYEHVEHASDFLKLEASKISHYLFTCEDITLLKQNRDEMERLAFYDQLTGLESRLLFKLRLENTLARTLRENKITALMFIDLDHFKHINDTYGHDVGDEVLKSAASRIKQSVRKNDTVARISGDEFTVIVADIVEHSVAQRVAEDIRYTLTQPFRLSGVEHFISASIGISVTPDDAKDIETLIKNADTAMYQAKRNGRNDIQFYSHSMNREVKAKQQLEQDLRKALQEQQFRLAYQPIVDLTTSKLIALEALLRWTHPSKGVITPIDFIPLAEESGLILPLGKWVADQVVAASQQVRQIGLEHVCVSINITARQLRDEELMRDISRIINKHASEKRKVLLELTEDTLHQDKQHNNVNIKRLQDLGLTIAVDEFGAGGASVQALKQLPVEWIKIQRRFVQRCLLSDEDAQVVKAIIAIAQSLQLKVVAVGVESAEQVNFLKEHGCTMAQGHFFARAGDLDDVLNQFSANNVVKLTPPK